MSEYLGMNEACLPLGQAAEVVPVLSYISDLPHLPRHPFSQECEVSWQPWQAFPGSPRWVLPSDFLTGGGQSSP